MPENDTLMSFLISSKFPESGRIEVVDFEAERHKSIRKSLPAFADIQQRHSGPDWLKNFVSELNS